MTKGYYQNEWLNAIDEGTLLTKKHDPNDLTDSSIYRDKSRSVVSPAVSSSIRPLIASGEYDVYRYINTNPRHNPDFFVIVPYSGSFQPVGGKANGTPYTSSQCDLLTIVSGSSYGWKIFSEDSATLTTRITTGELVFSGSL